MTDTERAAIEASYDLWHGRGLDALTNGDLAAAIAACYQHQSDIEHIRHRTALSTPVDNDIHTP